MSTIDVNGKTVRGYDVSFGKTVYGGTLDFVSGNLTETMKMIVADGTNVEVSAFSYNTTVQLYFSRIDISSAKGVPSTDNSPSVVSNMFVDNGQHIAVNKCYVTSDGTGIIFCADQSITSKEDMNNWLTTHNAQFCYKLETPVQTQLTPQQINTFYGQNYVWANTDNTAYRYRDDPPILP